MKPEQLSNIGLYGNREIFKRRLEEGYKEVALGRGDWIQTQNSLTPETRIVALWAFFHQLESSKKIATYEHPKAFDGVTNIHGKPFEATYSEEEFKEYCEKNKIKIGKRIELTDLLNIWS